jgi:putative pyruvate formate lyase activating enzyme
VFCQNFDISWKGEDSFEVSPKDLAKIMIRLQDMGCHNINFVTPEHVVPQILEAIYYAIEMGLKIPIVYNTSAYDSEESIELMDGIVDIYMPDFKIWDPEISWKYLGVRDYPDVARKIIKKMWEQVGDLKFDENGLALRGLLVRHLVMPGNIAGTDKIMQFIAKEVSFHTYVNIMDQYYPAGLVAMKPKNYPELYRRITSEEYDYAIRCAMEAGLYRFDTRWLRYI